MITVFQTTSMKRIVLGISFLISIPFLCAWPAFSSTNKDVLVLHSYHKGLEWTDNITNAIEATFQESPYSVDIRYEYMDTKRVYDEKHLKNIAQLLQHKYKNKHFDTIISTDDHAFRFLLQFQNEIFPTTPIVFCGVNDFKDAFVADNSLVTGVLEDLSLNDTIETALRIDSTVKKIYAISDATVSGLALKERLMDVIPEYTEKVEFVFIEKMNIEEVQHFTQQLQDNSIVLWLIFTQDNDGNIFSHVESLGLVSQFSSRPIYSFWDFYLDHGVVGGKVISGIAQGKTAANLAIQIFSGKSPAAIPIIKESPNRYLFDYNVLQKYKLSMSGLPEGAEVINKPVSFYDENKALIWRFSWIIVGLVIVILTISINLIKRRRAEESLKKSEERLRTVFRAASEVSFIISDTTKPVPNILEFSPGAENIFGYQREDVLNKPLSLLQLPQEIQHFTELTTSSASDSATFSGEVTLLRANGENFPALFSTYPLVDGQGVVWGGLGVCVDIAEQKQTQEALRQSEERFRELSEMLPETIFEMDFNNKVTFLNKGGLEKFQYEADDLKDDFSMLRLFPQKEHAKLQNNVNQIKEGQNLGLNEYIAVRKNGDEFPVMARSTVVMRDGKIVGVRGFLIDISEKKLLEKQIRNAQKMESIGTLAGGVAHDFNNLLMGIQGRTSLAKSSSGPNDPSYEHLLSIEEYVQSASNLTNQLLGFARSGKYVLKTTDMSQLISKTAEMFSRTNKDLHIVSELQPDLWAVEVDKTQIEQVLLNLFINAWQAINGKGELLIQTSNVDITEAESSPLPVDPGQYIRIIVADSGPGMDAKTQEKIFEPFFTTKDRTRGTGLGLASAYGIIKNHKGFIDVFSENGDGASFQIHLPATMEIPEVAAEPEDKILTGSETILIVDDESLVIDVASEMLELLGYTVIAVKSGEEAISLFHEKSNEIDLVILDMIMPGLSGEETFVELRLINPDISVLLSSGYSVDGQATKILEMDCNGFIQKPFDLLKISRKIREVLEPIPQ